MGLQATVLFSVYFALSSIGAMATPVGEEFHGRKLLRSLRRDGYTTLLSAIKAAGLSDDFSRNESLTLLAPTNEAFERLPKGLLKELLKPKNAPQLRALLSAHLIKGRKDLRTLVANETRETKAGNQVRFGIANGHVTVNGSARVIRANVSAQRAIYHVVSEVLVPADFPLMPVQTIHRELDLKRRTEALRTLRSMGSAAKGATPALVKMILDRSDPLRAEAMTTLRALGTGASGAAAALGSIAKDSNDPLAREAFRTLQSLGRGAKAAVPAMAEILERRPKSHATSDRPKLLKISADWSSNVSKRGLEADVIEIRVKAGGSVKLLDCKANRVSVRGSGGGTVTLSGVTNSLTLDMSGGTSLRASGLRAHEVKGDFSGGSISTVNAEASLVVDVSGASRVSYVKTEAKVHKRVGRYSKFRPITDEPRAKALH